MVCYVGIVLVRVLIVSSMMVIDVKVVGFVGVMLKSSEWIVFESMNEVLSFSMMLMLVSISVWLMIC